MRVSRVILAAFLSLLASPCLSSDMTQGPNWVLGKWISCDRLNEALTFSHQESAQLTRNGTTTPFVYKVVGDTVKLGAIRVGELEPFWLEPIDSHRALRVVLPKGRSTTYVRPGNKDKQLCHSR